MALSLLQPLLLILLPLLPLGGGEQTFPPPADRSQEAFAIWFEELTEWKSAARAGLNLSLYSAQGLQWAATSFVQPQVMLHDRFLYDRTSGEWTVKRFLEDLRTRYGGVDSLLLWQGYPNIGLDDRNQFDMTASLPGGLDGLRELVTQLHAEGIRVLLPYLPWDQLTRPTEQQHVAELIQQVLYAGLDGINGDTMDGVGEEWWREAETSGLQLALEPEVFYGDLSYLQWDVMSWGYWSHDGSATQPPLVSAYKAVTGSRHMTHICERWMTDHKDAIQQAFFNGAGFESWENVWGIWNGITERDGELLRRAATILRWAGPLVTSEDWIPHLPVSPASSAVYASQFTAEINGVAYRLWTLVNRGLEDEEVDLSLPCSSGGGSWLDLYHGDVLDGVICNEDEGISWFARISIESGGIGAVLWTETEDLAASGVEELLTTMEAMTELPLASFNSTWTPLQQVLEDTALTEFHDRVFVPSDNSVLVPGGGFNFTVTGNAIECMDALCPVDVQFPWETRPQRWHSRQTEVPDLWMDKHLVTDSQFSAFLAESGWRPRDEMNFLKHWLELEDPATSQRPVIWVSVWDAAAYCGWQGGRLPTSWEWQWAAQGDTGQGWPWGWSLDDSMMPPFTSGRSQPLPEPVGGFPQAAAWSGVQDLVGWVYQWTDVFTDSHTSRAVLRGAPRWRPNGREMAHSWYQPLSYGKHWSWPDISWETAGPLAEHNTVLLLSDGMDRSGGVGFRCVADVVLL